MIFKRLSYRNLLTTVALLSCSFSFLPIVTYAQSNSGLTIFSGVERENILDYHLDFGGNAGSIDRYRLRVPGKKLMQGVSKFFISYPDYYKGKFDTDKIEVRVKGKSLPIREVIWDKESYLIEIDLEQPLKESNKVEIVFSNVKNPRFGGTFYFQCQILPASDLPIRQHLGTWILSINP
ncbi:MAG: DUF2808 domain-containing protein [Stanieria sp.]